MKAKKYKKVIDYYDNATDDYKFWSKDYNMHFGLAIWNIFNREKMLRKMNSYILNKSGVSGSKEKKFIDLGCGCGGTLRQGCKENSTSNITGVTLSKWQIAKCNELLQKSNTSNGKVLEEDYHNLPFSDSQFDSGYALESLCHSQDREKVIQEASRVIKKGGNLVIADGFLKIKLENASGFFKKSFDILCKGWAIPDFANIDDFKTILSNHHFKITEMEDLSWKIAPSVIHSPFVILKYLLYALVGKAPLKEQNLNNLKGSFMGLWIGIQRRKFSYFMIKAVKI